MIWNVIDVQHHHHQHQQQQHILSVEIRDRFNLDDGIIRVYVYVHCARIRIKKMMIGKACLWFAFRFFSLHFDVGFTDNYGKKRSLGFVKGR